MVDRRLLQMNKSFQQLKGKQKEKIVEWMFQAYRKQTSEKQSDEEALQTVFERIEEADIWIPDYEILNRYRAKKKQFANRIAGENVPQHIYQMESILNKAVKKMDALEKMIAEYKDFQPEIRKLEAYYTSSQWKEDLAMDEAGKFPEKLKRGVLSEDGIWNVLERNQELIESIGIFETTEGQNDEGQPMEQTIQKTDTPRQQELRKVAVVTGGASGIGKCIAEEFRKQDVKVYVIDKAEGDHYTGDISDQAVLEDFAEMVIRESGGIDYLINNALPLMKGIDECSYEEFQYALAVGVTAPFYLSKLFAPYFRKGACIINISSSRDRMSQPQTESYTAAKGGIAALTHALAASFAGKVRVNSISPGWIDTAYTVYEGPDALQQPAGRVGNPMDIANMALFLCSDKAGFITGENICIDGGMTKLMIYHDDHGWTYTPDYSKGRL